jgi:CheY-like chemotaxis protein
MTPLNLLVVEDDPASLELMAEVFTSLKANVRAVSDSQHAAGLVNQERFDGIFLDLEMPNLHGFDLARVICKSSWNKSTPIIIVTGRDERETMQQAFTIGATFFLQKPVDSGTYCAVFPATAADLEYLSGPAARGRQQKPHCSTLEDSSFTTWGVWGRR